MRKAVSLGALVDPETFLVGVDAALVNAQVAGVEGDHSVGCLRARCGSSCGEAGEGRDDGGLGENFGLSLERLD